MLVLIKSLEFQLLKKRGIELEVELLADGPDLHYFSVTYTKEGRRQWHPTPVLFAWKIPWTEEPGRLQSMGLLRVGHD